MSQIAPPNTPSAATPSLRDGRRDLTLRSIHAAARDLAFQNGLAATTVAEIATAAGVSERTVFNYYRTKEDAVLGLITPTIPTSAVASFTERASQPGLLERTVELLTAILKSMNIAGQDIADRARLFTRFPELLDTLHRRLLDASDLLDHALRAIEAEVELTAVQRHALRSAASAIVQDAFVLVDYQHFPTKDDLIESTRQHREALTR